MGDGRYYTPEQFFSIIYLTLFIIGMLVHIMINVYKGWGNVRNRQIVILSILLGVVGLLSFSEAVVVSLESRVIITDCVRIIILVMNFLFIRFNISYKARGDQQYNKKLYYVSVILFWLMPMTIFVGAIMTNLVTSKLLEYGLYLMIAIGLVIITSIFTPYRVSASVFTDVRKLMLDYVYITDEKGCILYRNSSVENSEVFKPVKTIDIGSLASIFKDEISFRQAYSKKFIECSSEKERYLSYSYKQIIKDSKAAGYIITLTNITRLVLMLDELKVKQQESAKSNDALLKYKESVYEIEKEKEINALLEEIAVNQQYSMSLLKEAIGQLDNCEESDFIEVITEIIRRAKKDLADVREAVTTYMNYYGG